MPVCGSWYGVYFCLVSSSQKVALTVCIYTWYETYIMDAGLVNIVSWLTSRCFWNDPTISSCGLIIAPVTWQWCCWGLTALWWNSEWETKSDAPGDQVCTLWALLDSDVILLTWKPVRLAAGGRMQWADPWLKKKKNPRGLECHIFSWKGPGVESTHVSGYIVFTLISVHSTSFAAGIDRWWTVCYCLCWKARKLTTCDCILHKDGSDCLCAYLLKRG